MLKRVRRRVRRRHQRENMMVCITSAPTKIILTGEHYVVYGAPAISFAVGRFHRIESRILEGLSWSEKRIDIINPIGNGTIYPDRIEGPDYLEIYRRIYYRILQQCEERRKDKNRTSNDCKIPPLKINIIPETVPKGMGTSASLGVAFALNLYTIAGIKPDEEELFECAQLGETVAHGGRPSGIDARTVVSGNGLIFKKLFNPVRYVHSNIDIVFPSKTRILLIDTHKRGEDVDTTGELVKRFAKNHGITSLPNELTDKERMEVVKEYIDVFKEMKKYLNKNADPEKLGLIFNKNHQLLKDSGVSSKGIEDARKIAEKYGALGSKLTGAGGRGGAVITLCYEKDKERIEKAVMTAGYNVLEISVSIRGPNVERHE